MASTWAGDLQPGITQVTAGFCRHQASAQAAIGAIGVAEPAALLASQGGTLLLAKVKSGNLTLAIAEMPN